ncbi:MAG: DUF3536 domain-containing protein [Bacillota bacterium]
MNSDALIYGGSGLGNPDGAPARPMPRHDRPYSVELTLPPLGTVFLTLISNRDEGNNRRMSTDHKRYICIHGHFYQPPRENPWLEAIDIQESAQPYHDWNERITHECYAPNAASRILDQDGRIREIVNNYSRISFNFGPTLLAWLETGAPDVYRAVIEADRDSRQFFSGHGSALAQPYSHPILPLAGRRDKETQVIWGIRDFEHRFGRKPAGMWLPETAVDLETLAVLAEQGIRFTILAPHQARRVRAIGAGHWKTVGPEGIDTSMPYRLNLEAGRSIGLFFYDAAIAREVAFEGLLSNGEQFADRLYRGFDYSRDRPQLVHFATDGETYGHHHRHGDMALAYALRRIAANGAARLTNYAEYLALYPPTHEVEIAENTSWSCVHGIERWRNDCGCHSGAKPAWNQAWRRPLREAVDWLVDTVAPRYEEEAQALFKDPWRARNEYIGVILDRSPENVGRFLAEQGAHPLGQTESVTALKLLELQRHALLMGTSCGWFFDDLAEVQTVQSLRYAGRVIQLAQELFDEDLESPFLDILSRAESNVAEYRNGVYLYEQHVRPAMVDLPQVAAHYAISSLFEDYAPRARIYCYTVERLDHKNLASGRIRLTVGRARVTSEITRESAALCYGVLYFGDHNLSAGVRAHRDEDAYRALVQAVTAAFEGGSLPEVIRILDRYFEGIPYSLKLLFRDEQRKILDQILASTLADLEANYRHIYEHHASLMRFLGALGIPQPKELRTAAEFVLNTDLRRAFADEEFSLKRIAKLLDQAAACGVPLDSAGLDYVLEQTMERMAGRLQAEPHNLDTLTGLNAAVGLARSLPFTVDLWKVQNIYYELLQRVYSGFEERAAAGDDRARVWIEHFAALGDKLRMRRGA